MYATIPTPIITNAIHTHKGASALFSRPEKCSRLEDFSADFNVGEPQCRYAMARRITPNVQHTEDTHHLRHRRVGA